MKQEIKKDKNNVRAWIARHAAPKTYADPESDIDPEMGPEQAYLLADSLKKDLNQDQRTKLYFVTSELKRAVRTASLVLKNIEDWIKHEHLSNISIESFQIQDFLETTQGPIGLIEEPRWLPQVTSLKARRGQAYLSWLLDVDEEIQREWDVETPSDVERNVVEGFHAFYELNSANNPDVQTIMVGLSSEPTWALLKRHTQDRKDFTVGYVERLNTSLEEDGVHMQWRSNEPMLTKWKDVLTQRPVLAR